MNVHIFDVESGHHLAAIKVGGPCKFVEWNRKPNMQDKFVLAHDSFGAGSPKGIAVFQWDLETESTPQRVWEASDYEGRCSQTRWGPFDSTIICIHDTGDILIWDAATGDYINQFQAHELAVTCCAFTDDRLLMLTTSANGAAKLWDTVKFDCLKQYKTDRPLNACAISPRFALKGKEQKMHVLLGGGQAADQVTTTAAEEGRFEALLYHMVYGDEVGKIKGHFGPVNSLAWMPNGNGYASGGEDGYVRVYRFDDDYFTPKYE
eukprot:GHVT01073893.1.p1 GENE.GHVT01073893.1~~GHVT01073893.1.p1  ORF type:complete len:263 (+),score=43.33 GHVT01073893.1:219-1007(+)